MKSFYIAVSLCICSFMAHAQTDARLIGHPDVSKDKIVFAFGDDLWVVAKSGGKAFRFSSPDGAESNPRFSPDGKTIAFNANYDGNYDIYTMPVEGGVPKRVTTHGMSDLLLDWYADGKSLMYKSSMASGKQRFNQFYKISTGGGLPEKLPLMIGEHGSLSLDGNTLAFTERTRSARTWKRYRGGMAADIFLLDMKNLTSTNINNSEANDEYPMWHGDVLYYLSDASTDKRLNIWKYNPATKAHTQVTKFTDFDIHYPSMGPDDIVFEAGGLLYILNLSDEKYKSIDVSCVGDFASLRTYTKNVKEDFHWYEISPDGNRVLVEARGDVFSLPKEKGFVENITRSSGSAERFPAWSPDGKSIAMWSDASGEYELTIYDVATSKTRTVTKMGPGFRYTIFWSPDSKNVAFIDQAMKIKVANIATGNVKEIGKDIALYEDGLRNFALDWSADSRWITFSITQENSNSAIFIYEMASGKLNKVTSAFYSDHSPVFDPDGKYLYFKSNRAFTPSYSDFDPSWAYNNSTKLMALTLRKDVASPLALKNDEVKMKEEEKKEEPAKDEKPEPKKKKGKKDVTAAKDTTATDDEVAKVKIDFDGIEARTVELSMPSGNYGGIAATSGKLIYTVFPNTGSEGGSPAIKFYDVEEQESKTIVEGVGSFELSADGQNLAVGAGNNSVSVIKVQEGQKADKLVPTEDMVMKIDPKAEWKQIFNDAWRIERDYFYDPGMHGLDWNALRTKYGALIDQCVTRNDVNFVIGELIGEMDASHTYRGGGDIQYAKPKSPGYLGADYALVDGKYQIKKIIRGGAWDTESVSPLDQPGLGVKDGDFLLAVNGIALSDFADPYVALEGQAGKTVELTIADDADGKNERKVLVKAMSEETRLRNLAWIEANRKYVDEKTNGKIGYIFVPSTGVEDGQYELVRMFYAQWNKDGLIIDERFNNGGQIPDRFIELLNRKPLSYFKVRDGKDWQWPVNGGIGPKVMLINGWSGSGGDAFPDYFRKAGLGPLIGTRTWGGLIGISGTPDLIDGGSVTAPTFRAYDPDGKWFREGYGVDPDIEVKEDPGQLAKGVDVQLDRAIKEVMDALAKKGPLHPQRPSPEDRSH